METEAIIILVIVSAIMVWVYFPIFKNWWRKNTPEGYEDETGFHEGKDPRNEK